MHNQLDESTRIWGMSCHLAALALFALPFGSILGPLIVWLIQKDKHPFIMEQGKEAVNFQISMVIYTILLTLLPTLILSILLCFCLLIAASSNLSLYLVSNFQILFLIIASIQIVFVLLTIFELIIIIFAAIRTYNGQSYRYPFNLRFLK